MIKEAKQTWNLKVTYKFTLKITNTQNKVIHERIEPSFKLPIAALVTYNTK